MITMLHYDAVRNPLPPEVATLTQSGPKKQPILTEVQHLAYLQSHPYQQFSEEEIENVISEIYIFNINYFILFEKLIIFNIFILL